MKSSPYKVVEKWPHLAPSAGMLLYPAVKLVNLLLDDPLHNLVTTLDLHSKAHRVLMYSRSCSILSAEKIIRATALHKPSRGAHRTYVISKSSESISLGLTGPRALLKMIVCKTPAHTNEQLEMRKADLKTTTVPAI